MEYRRFGNTIVARIDRCLLYTSHDDVRILDRREPVRDDEHRAPLHELIHAALHERLRAGVDGAGRLVDCLLYTSRCV